VARFTPLSPYFTDGAHGNRSIDDWMRSKAAKIWRHAGAHLHLIYERSKSLRLLFSIDYGPKGNRIAMLARVS
jgi:hypothetical protein